MAEVLKMHNVAGLKISAAVEYVARQAEQGLLSEPLAGVAVMPLERLVAQAQVKTKKKRVLHEIVEYWLRAWCNPNKWPLPMSYRV
ncbi:hypothetical protein E4T85_22760 [Bacillus stratosphericus]|nr:hypothetical protein E4T85_22760 [Bacillus stratosphericus]